MGGKGAFGLARFRRLLSFDDADLTHIDFKNTPEERRLRLAVLSENERSAYRCLSEGFSESWTTETLGLHRGDAKKLYRSIYRKLGVENQRGITEHYAMREAGFLQRRERPTMSDGDIMKLIAAVKDNTNF